MRIIKQSFEPVIDTGDHVQNIANASRICYKSEGKALDDETPFVNGLVKGKHSSTLEMSVVHLKIKVDCVADLCDLLASNYIIHAPAMDDNNGSYCTGSIRGWREFIFKCINENITDKDLILRISSWFISNIDSVFTDDLPIGINHENHIEQFDPKTLPTEIAKRHIHQGIKFITNRAVTHEFVRHRPVAFLQESQRYCMYSKEQFGNSVTFIEPTAFYPEGSEEYRVWKHSLQESEASYMLLLESDLIPENQRAQAARTVLPNSCKTELIIYCSLKQWEHIFAMRDSTAAEPSMREAIEPPRDWMIETYPEYFNDPVNKKDYNWKRSIG